MPINFRKEDALNYHTQGQPGKIEVTPTKPLVTQLDLALAYSPGVAEPCKEIHKSDEKVYDYTSKGNLVGVISNGTAVLGLGNIGASASKPVMEGKGVLFKRFAGIDVFDIEINETDPKKFVEIVKSLEPTFGGINLEDIKAPEAFYIEEELRKQMSIPVMHDDQHGTAIIASAALVNALTLADKKLSEVRIVINGAGAAAISCANLILEMGARNKNLILLDSKGCIRDDRTDLNETKRRFATSLDIHTLKDSLVGADVFIGLSVGNVLKPAMVKSMADSPIIFALANPTPEIDYNKAIATRPDAMVATGRSDHPNQVNNVLGFPFIFRGALDVRSTQINQEMKLAAVKAIAELAKEPVPEIVKKAYGEKILEFGPKYLIPKPLDPRLITRIPPAVAKAAIKSKVAKKKISDWDAYEEQLLKRLGLDQRFISRIINQAKEAPKVVVFAEADNPRILKAARLVHEEGIGIPILLGNEKLVREKMKEHGVSLKCKIINPSQNPQDMERYGKMLYEKRKRKGMTYYAAIRLMRERNYFASAMVEMGHADLMISGMNREYPKCILPPLQTIGPDPHIGTVAGMYALMGQKGLFFLADTTINQEPSSEELVQIIGLVAETVRSFGIEPRIALLSFSNLGSAKGEVPEKMQTALKKAWEIHPDILIDGEFQAHIAVSAELQQKFHPFSKIAEKGANTLIFPDLGSGNIAYNLLAEIGGMEGIGPILMGMNKPVQILQRSSSVREIVNMVAVGVVDAQHKENRE